MQKNQKIYLSVTIENYDFWGWTQSEGCFVNNKSTFVKLYLLLGYIECNKVIENTHKHGVRVRTHVFHT